MHFEDLLFRYFGTREVNDISATSLSSGIERMEVDLGMATDAGQRFALWCLLYMLNSAPDLDVALMDESEREAARNFMDLIGFSRLKNRQLGSKVDDVCFLRAKAPWQIVRNQPLPDICR